LSVPATEGAASSFAARFAFAGACFAVFVVDDVPTVKEGE
jgi:hypothetical protein